MLSEDILMEILEAFLNGSFLADLGTAALKERDIERGENVCNPA